MAVLGAQSARGRGEAAFGDGAAVCTVGIDSDAARSPRPPPSPPSLSPRRCARRRRSGSRALVRRGAAESRVAQVAAGLRDAAGVAAHDPG
jgi:hypothetical protein